MFSELCRETLRKAAVCYSARAGSPSPSPPTSPPPSPAKEAKTAANADLANVRDAIHEGVRDHQHHHHHSGTTTAGKRTSPTGNTTSESGQRDPASERSASDRPTDRPNDFRDSCESHVKNWKKFFLIRKPWRKRKHTPRKRPAMPTDFSKRLPGLEAREGRRSGTCGTTEFRESRSVSPEKGTGRQHEDHRGGGGSAGNECGRSDTRISRRSSGSSPEPEDNSSTSGDEGEYSPKLMEASYLSSTVSDLTEAERDVSVRYKSSELAWVSLYKRKRRLVISQLDAVPFRTMLGSNNYARRHGADSKRHGVMLGATDRRSVRDLIADANDPTNFPIVRRQPSFQLPHEEIVVVSILAALFIHTRGLPPRHLLLIYRARICGSQEKHFRNLK
ncbi:hypothetical protein G5I_06442 [Acromyrmex echinatior]|uniref:Uncharacterized protein n=1 Tax=Acromyrmex echinatior TaxID=103372 RepID=F4WL19_ACREC|nr:hypothetical protein G5I_06442 [Acromyrmex echinatior]